MKTLFISILIFPLILFSQSESKVDSLNMENKWGLTFGLKGLTLEKFEGGIGGKYWFSNDYVAYLSFDFWISNTNYYSDTREYLGGGISTGIEKHFFLKKIVSPFIGIGLRYDGSTSQSKVKDFNDISTPKRNNKDQRHLFSAGVFGGIEIFVLDFISLSANYGIWFFYTEHENKRYYNDGSRSTTRYDSKYINTTVSSLNFSIYF